VNYGVYGDTPYINISPTPLGRSPATAQLIYDSLPGRQIPKASPWQSQLTSGERAASAHHRHRGLCPAESGRLLSAIAGLCEGFATAMTMMLRDLQIRLVT
jgi:hypothetical protein